MQHSINLDSLHVVSDLHLGGQTGFQIFGSTSELVWLIEHVAGLPGPGTHGLLINGDFVDFLAEEPALPFDPEGAVAKLDRVWEHFNPVFLALRRLLTKQSGFLIVNLGNHDVELALPWVRTRLIELLTKGNPKALTRLLIVTDGTGVRCQVGNASVVCVHGNEVDSWNVVDFEKLRRITREFHFGMQIESWVPNAGTQLVIEVMNTIKKAYPFVDLLKPEKEGVLPLLAALDTGVHRKLINLVEVAGRRAVDVARMSAGFLDDDKDLGSRPGTPSPSMHLVFPGPASGHSSQQLLIDVESAWQHGVQPISLVRGTQDQQLGFWSAAKDLISGKPRHEVLRQALEQLDRDRSFDAGTEDQTFRDLDDLISADVDLILAGHTHLERSLPRRRGRGHYFNSGTWARLMRIQPELRQDPRGFQSLFALLDGASMSALDQARIAVGSAPPGEIVLRRNTVIQVDKTPTGGATAALRHVVKPAPDQPFQLESASGAATWQKG